MSLSNLTTGTTYACNGATTSFAIAFDWNSVNDIKVYKILITTGVKTLLTPVTDYTFSPDDITPTSIDMVVAPSALYRLRIERDTPRTQLVDYINNSAFLAEDHEEALDKIVLMVQELSEQVGRALKVSILDAAADPNLTPLVADTFLLVNSTGDGFVPGPTLADITGGAASGVPTGGIAGDYLEKASSTDGDLVYVPTVLSGYSSRFGAAWSSLGLFDAISKIVAITYTAPLASLTASGASSIREKGTAVTSSTLSVSVTKRSDPIAAVRFYLGATLINTVAVPNPAGGTETYAWTGSFSDNTTFNAQVDDNGATGGPSTVTSSSSFTFVYPYYSDAGAVGLTAAQVGALSKTLITSTATVTKTMTATAGQVFYFAYLASYGALTSILDVNNFETIGDWTLTTSNITGLDGSAQSYRIYKFNNPVTAGSYQYTFKR